MFWKGCSRSCSATRNFLKPSLRFCWYCGFELSACVMAVAGTGDSRNSIIGWKHPGFYSTQHNTGYYSTQHNPGYYSTQHWENGNKWPFLSIFLQIWVTGETRDLGKTVFSFIFSGSFFVQQPSWNWVQKHARRTIGANGFYYFLLIVTLSICYDLSPMFIY